MHTTGRLSSLRGVSFGHSFASIAFKLSLHGNPFFVSGQSHCRHVGSAPEGREGLRSGRSARGNALRVALAAVQWLGSSRWQRRWRWLWLWLRGRLSLPGGDRQNSWGSGQRRQLRNAPSRSSQEDGSSSITRCLPLRTETGHTKTPPRRAVHGRFDIADLRSRGLRISS